MGKVAVLVDGGFYQKRASYLFGEKTPEQRANEMCIYARRHVSECDQLYRIFYYDCPPSDKNIYHPLTQARVDLKKTAMYSWCSEFQKVIVTKRKVALRWGELLESDMGYTLKPSALKKLCRKEISVDDLTESDFSLNIVQKGVDLRIGLDISALATKHFVDQIVLIAGDSDFVPAAKMARREGIDFILDPLWQPIKPSLQEHIDGLMSKVSSPNGTHTDPLSTREGNIVGKF